MVTLRQHTQSLFIYSALLSALSLSVEARQLREVPDDVIHCDAACIQVAYPYALMSRDVYDNHATYDQQGWSRGLNPIVFDFQNNDALFFDDATWTIQDDDGLHMGLYVNSEQHQALLAIRGTEFDSLDDLITDVQQLFGAIPEQYENALAATAEMLPYIEQAGYSLSVTGHSLGGGVAQYIANSFSLPAITFNTAPISDRVETDSFARQYPEGVPNNAPLPSVYNLVFRKQGGWWSGYDIIANSYSGADSGGLLGTSFSLVTEDGVGFLELHSLDKMLEEMRRQAEL
ncbi:hypothetical protein [Candidatus Albibeggiatoa sp. nov. NOAA]|uniref:hypothetical protein n=1 Tax=Candidatus Albibeggiatoa sp. nov. NOAA TaxID=3162724 RepID=UPI0033011A8F|nr:hypothetical protein [Thiotrichaceae bacterium]